MKTLKQIERLRKANKLIRQQNTGTPAEFASKLHVSERELYRLIEYLKEIDARISFSRNSNTYYYTDDFDLLVHIKIQVLVREEIKTIYAGSSFLRRNFEEKPLFSTTAMFGQ
jgi:predicted DNA-binding transcriptional regulator YafY